MSLPATETVLVIAAVTLGIYVLLVVAARILRRAWGVRFGPMFHLFSTAVGALIAIAVSPWRTEASETAMRHLTAAVIFLGAFPIASIVRRLLTPTKNAQNGEKRGAAPRVLSDIFTSAIVIVAVLVMLQGIYGIQVPGLLAGSGIIALVLGLALQDLLGNIFAGLAIHSEKTYETGDWLLIEGTHAKVIEITWRSTRMLTFDNVLIDVPNSHVIRHVITNFEKPTPRHALRTIIKLHYSAPPQLVQKVLAEATATVPGVLNDTPPTVLLREYNESCIDYEIKFWVAEHESGDGKKSQVRIRCWYACQRAGFQFGHPQLVLNQPAPALTDVQARSAAADTLRGHAIFSFLTTPQIETLLAASPVVYFAAFEPVIRQGEAGKSMFLIVRGRVDVSIKADGANTTVASMSAGECFGEMSLLTGEVRTATVIAATEMQAVEITKESFTTLMRGNRDIISRLSDLLVQRQHANEQTLTRAPFPQPDAAKQARASMLTRLHHFFNLDD